jgi:hypothetical protein
VAPTGWYGSLDRCSVDRVPEVLERCTDIVAEESMAMFKALEKW